MSRRLVFSVGYEGKNLDELVKQLVRAGVRRVVDVRALPLSRRPGFSKTPLREALARRDIDYVHVREAGNPYRDLRDDPERCLRLYAKYLDAHPDVLDVVKRAIGDGPSALLCLEASHEHCHRSVIARTLGRGRARFRFEHLP